MKGNGSECEKIAIFADAMNIMGMIRDINRGINFSALLKFIERKLNGQVVIKKIFYDVFPRYNDNVEEFLRSLEKFNFEKMGVDVKSYSSSSSNNQGKKYKSITDTYLVTEAMETLCERSEEFSTFILMAGDCDYKPLLEKMKKKGKRTVVISVKRTLAPELTDKYLSDEVFILDEHPELLKGKRD